MLRPARPDDAAGIAGLLGRDPAGDRACVLEEEGRLLAVVAVSATDLGTASDLAVAPELRGRGYGRRLAEFATGASMSGGAGTGLRDGASPVR